MGFKALETGFDALKMGFEACHNRWGLRQVMASRV
jgi:hypothetical protein